MNDDDGHLCLIADLVHTPQSWTGRQLATGCIITIMSCFQFIVSVIVTVARWTVMSCSLPGVGSLLLSQNKTPTDSLATGPWAPSHPDSGVQCLSLSLTLSLADLSKHRPLGISLEPNSDGEGKHWCRVS